MYQRTTVVLNKSGLHLRPASQFVALANKSGSDITIKRVESGASCDAKSIVLLLHLAVAKGTEIEISAQGEDEIDTVDALIGLVESGFDE